MIVSSQMKFWIAFLLSGTLDEFAELGDIENIFTDQEALKIYHYVRETIAKHGVVPSLESVESYLGETFPALVGETSWGILLDQITDLWIKSNMQRVFNEAAEIVQSGKEPTVALDNCISELSLIKAQALGPSVSVFTKMGPSVIKQYKLAKAGTVGVMLGVPYIDNQMMGLRKGDLMSLVARTRVGKSWWLLSIAKNIFDQGKRVLFISMEMSREACEERLASLWSGIPYFFIRRGELPTLPKNMEVEFFNTVTKIEASGEIIIVDANLSVTAEDVLSLSIQHQPDVIIVDGAYLFQASRRKGSSWEMIIDSCNYLKSRVAVKTPVIASWQFNREAVKKLKKKGQDGDPDLEDIAGSDAIGNISSVVLSMLVPTDQGLADSGMDEYRTIKIIKGRSGETGQFRINWLFNKMDFSEYVEGSKHDLDNVASNWE